MSRGRLVWIEWDGRQRPRKEVIHELVASGWPVADIARRLGVSYQIVYLTLRSGEHHRVPELADDPTVAAPVDPGSVDALLLGCVKSKDMVPRPAKDLYVSEMFRRRRLYAEARGLPWWIVSAEYGLVAPDEVIAPYDTLIGRRPLHERHAVALQVADRLERELGSLRSRRLELHAGEEYYLAINPELRRRGAVVVRPLEGLGFGEQLAWYGARLGLSGAAPAPGGEGGRRPPHRPPPLTVPAASPGDGRGLARRITELFCAGKLDLSSRVGAPVAGWEGMPEVVAVRRIRTAGADPIAVRLFLTFNAAMDRARDADRLATAAAGLFHTSPWVFDPAAIVERPLTELADALRAGHVSQRHSTDAFGWRVLAETLADETLAPEARSAIHDGHGDARRLLAELAHQTRDGTPLFPLLGGPKVGPLWVRLLAYPGDAQISSLEAVPVAVDVQVRKVTEYLGVTDTAGRSLDDVRAHIQAAWAADVAAHGAAGPDGLANTPGALDPALWFYGKWGCSFCERARRRLPVADVCLECRYPPAQGVTAHPGD